MIKNYLFSTYKNLIKQRAFALINIFGLSIGLSVFMLIALYVDKEISYDRQWQNSERIVRLNMVLRPDSLNPAADALTSFLIMPALQQYFSDDIELYARRVIRGRSVIIGEDSFPGGLWLYERDFIDIFKFEVIAGSLESTMEDPGRIGLSKSAALKYFGTVDVLGRTISLEVPRVGLIDYLVTAVYRIPEGESSQNFPSIALFDEAAMTENVSALSSWGPEGWFVTNYFLMNADTDLSLMNSQMDDFMAQHTVPVLNADDFILRFQKLLDIHFNPTISEQGGDKFQLIIYSMIAILVLLVGSINFIILNTANSIDRRQEIGVRKVAGASKSQVVFQFFVESIFLTFIAFIFALMLLELSLPSFSILIAQDLRVEYFTLSNLLFMMILILTVGGLGGLYPALMLASLKPSGMLKGNGGGNIIGSVEVRNSLVGFQFSISIFLLIAALVLYAQLSLFQNRDHGFNAENLIVLRVPGASLDEKVRLTHLLMIEIEKLPDVEGVALSISEPNGSINMLPSIPITSELRNDYIVNSMGLFVDYNFFAVYEIPLLAGRVYDVRLDLPEDGAPGPVRKIVINRFAAKALGFSSPETAIGQQSSSGEIIGVVENSEFLSLRRDINAEIYPLLIRSSRIITVRFHKSSLGTINSAIETVWRNVIGDVPLDSNFVSQGLQEVFTQEENDGKLLIVLSLLSILVSSMGLYGLVAFAIKRQVKEVGIRKVLGAEFITILKLFVWQFTKPVLLANVIAWPLAVWVMINWLQRFPYQINMILLLPICMTAGLITLFIATTTVMSTVAKSANAKPVLALRYE